MVARPEQDRLQIHLPRASIFEQSFDPRKYQRQTISMGDETIDTEPESFEGRSRELDQTETIDLWRMRNDAERGIEAGIFFHQRFALPIACLVLALVGIPLSISTHRSGRSTGVVLALALVFVYYMFLLAGTALAQEGILPPGPAIWAANLVFAAVGVRLLSQVDSPNRSDWLALLARPVQRWAKRLRSPSDTGEIPQLDQARRKRAERKERNGESLFDFFFPIADRYVLQRFLFYFSVMLAAFVSIWVVFSFFELLTDMLAHGKLALFLPYIYYLLPFLFYETAPLAVMVATLVCFGLLAKHHELTAFRACGVSLYRLAAPVLATSLLVSGALFALDHYTLPETNRRQDAIRDEIKDRPARTFLNADRQWTFGQDERIFYHRYFDWAQREMAPIFIYDFRLEPFDLSRHIYAERARWDDAKRAWVFENGWVRELDEGRVTRFEQFDQQTFSDIRETPEYFRKENKPHQQMNWRELAAYIQELNQAGFETSELIVQWHKKFSFPTFAFAMALLALPFAMVTGNRGALAPVAFALVVAISYYALSALFLQLGRASQLTPLMAAWAPGLIFCFTGGYLFLRVRT